MLLGKVDPVPKSAMGLVDVRDVALAHVKSITVEAAKGHRIFTWNQGHWRIDIAKTLHDEFQPQGWNIPLNEGPDTGDQKSKVDISPSTDILGIQYLPIKDTLIDMANSMISSGFVKKPE